ncbi:DUF7848 domain-containing protein [Streptomyces sp. NPDC004752]
MRSVLRYVDYVAKPDPVGEQTWQAECVTDVGDKDCGVKSPELGREQAVVDWMAEHTKETGHERFKRIYEDYALVKKAEK